MRKIIHVDMDCFYAAVEVKYRPELRGKALAVSGPPNTRSVLLTASYEARKFNVRSAMPTSRALRLCPNLILVPPNFELYRQESKAIREIFYRFTCKVEPLSLDEAYLDVTACTHFGGSATLIAQEIRRLIFTERELTASAGIAGNKFLAKIASDWNKPNGQYVISPAQVEEFVRELPIERIHGVGKVTAAKMHRFGLKTCADIQQHSSAQLAQWFGSWGPDLSNLARGIDQREVVADRERKSLTVEETFNRDIETLREVLKQLPALYNDWERRMNKGDYRSRIRGIVVKLKFHDFKTMTRENVFTEWPTLLRFEDLLMQAWQKRPEPVRLLGIGVRLATHEQKKATPQLSFDV